MDLVVVATFYKFVALDNLDERREQLRRFCEQREIKGTILLAEEGINATVAGTREAIDALLAHLRDDPKLADLSAREATHDTVPFQRLKVRVKPEIVTFRRDDADPNERVGRYIHPRQWNQLIDDPQVVVIDTRNEFEVEYGTFKGAVDPKTKKFSDFPHFVDEELDPQKHRKVAMFCTGGIRCEKATSHLLAQGFEEVYHLQGGILHYLEEIPEEESRWQGACFVFDERETVDHS